METVQGNRGPVLIFLHDWFTEPGEDWFYQVSYLKQFFRCHLFTLEGHGTRRPFKLRKDSIMEMNRKRLRDLIRRQTEPVYILAHGISSLLALQIALDHPRRIKAMILISPLARYPENRMFQYMHRFPRILTPLYMLWYDPLGQMGDPISRTWKRLRVLRSQAASQYMKDLDELDLRTRLSDIPLRICLISGNRDRAHSYDFAAEMNDALPNSYLVRYGNMGHSPHREEPDIINHIIHDFLRKSESVVGRGIEQIRDFFKNLFRKGEKDEPVEPEDSLLLPPPSEE